MITRKKIDEAANAVPRMRSLSYEHRTKAINHILIMAGKCGIKNDEWTASDSETMTRFVIDHFGNLNAKEISYAFELYASGQLLIPKGKEAFGKFHLGFLGALLSEYEKIKMQTKAEAPRPITDESRQLAPGDNITIWKADYLFMLKWIKEIGKIPDQGNFAPCFHYLKNTGRIKILQDHYAEIIATVRGLVNQEADVFQQPEQRNSYRKEFHHATEAFKNKCREEYFKWWIGEKLNDPVFLKTEIQSLNSEFVSQ